jgi:hypothetical protein
MPKGQLQFENQNWEISSFNEVHIACTLYKHQLGEKHIHNSKPYTHGTTYYL